MEISVGFVFIDQCESLIFGNFSFIFSVSLSSFMWLCMEVYQSSKVYYIAVYSFFDFRVYVILTKQNYASLFIFCHSTFPLYCLP